MTNQLAVFVLAFGFSLSVTPVVKRLALFLGIIDRPDPRKIHLVAIPLLGGMAIYAAAVIAFLLFIDGTAGSQIAAILAGATLLTVIGVLDDAGRLHHQVKLFFGMPLAALILIAGGMHATVFASLFATPSFPFDVASPSLPVPVLLLIADYVLTLLWVVGITAAISILDHMDGLVAGVSVIGALFYLIFAILGEQYLVGLLAAAVLGAALGFLRYNFNPASIFMGDAGALFLGFMMAVLGLKLHLPAVPPATSWMVPVLILGVPIFDTTLIVISRLRRGLIPFVSPGKDHAAHRLTDQGLSQRDAVLVCYTLGGLGGLLALLVSWLSVWQSYVVAGIVTLAALLAIVALERALCVSQRSQKSSVP